MTSPVGLHGHQMILGHSIGCNLLLRKWVSHSRTYQNGNYGDDGRTYIYKDTVGAMLVHKLGMS